MKSIYIKLLLPFLLFLTLPSKAERFSYVYIQGDKQIPFYVKLEDDMLPRYSKNYCIIPQLAPGRIRLQILFQQNAYPAQAFNVQVPADGYRGFLLVKNTDGFALFDIQQHFYLLPGAEGEDHLPEVNPTQSIIPITETASNTPKTITRNTVAKTQKNNRKSFSEEPPIVDNPSTENSQFIEGVELNNERKPIQNTTGELAEKEIIIPQEPQQPIVEEIPAQQETVSTEPPQETIETETIQTEAIYSEPETPSTENETINIANEKTVEESGMHDTEQEMNEPVPTLTESAPPIINSDCPEAISDTKFDDIFIASRAKNSDDKRIGYLMKKAGENCFTTRQVFLLSRQLQAESMRYSFLKKVFPRVTDQQNFHLLGDPLFKTLEWKSYFKLIYE